MRGRGIEHGIERDELPTQPRRESGKDARRGSTGRILQRRLVVLRTTRSGRRPE
jgi:hypothetical protein